jgi:hypothetical protein
MEIYKREKKQLLQRLKLKFKQKQFIIANQKTNTPTRSANIWL